jgi:predicted component of type VI protein secretion system
MFLGFLPAWVGDLSSILGIPAIVIAVLMWALGRRDANRKLIVEEGSLKKSEFDSFTAAQNIALSDARKEAAEAKAEVDALGDRLDLMDSLYDQMRETIMWLRTFVRKLVARTSYTMDPDEAAEFEMTKPPPRPPRRAPAHK